MNRFPAWLGYDMDCYERAYGHGRPTPEEALVEIRASKLYALGYAAGWLKDLDPPEPRR